MKLSALIIEDDFTMQALARLAFDEDVWDVFIVEDARAAFSFLESRVPTMIILDIMLTGMKGTEILFKIKSDSRTKNIPVIVSSSLNSDEDVIDVLTLGADDYVIKPYNPEVLAARVEAVMKRYEGSLEELTILTYRQLVLDLEKHELNINNKKIELFSTEYSILDVLIRNLGKTISRKDIIKQIRGSNYPVTDRSIDVHIANLRKKIGLYGQYIKTVRGSGYKLINV